MHYEIEQAGPDHEHGPDVGTHAEPERWHVVNVFNADAAALRHVPAGPDLRRTDSRYTADRTGKRRGRARADGHEHTMRHVAQAPSHYEVELRQPASDDGMTGT